MSLNVSNDDAAAHLKTSLRRLLRSYLKSIENNDGDQCALIRLIVIDENNEKREDIKLLKRDKDKIVQEHYKNEKCWILASIVST
ncbi:CLUMA_CG006638, isoform A [Clunio marinus]|uniref:CLUMA_CG006638, isoform A n=1 Tax=Clunio marinus TaxID=568069 RepID=A0A1J1I2P5_9DIPT|nr:CLUMA_CG006638, isoform A [Clunio marinus]